MKKNNENPYENLNYETLLNIWQTAPKGHEDLQLIRTTMNKVRRKEGRLIIGSCLGDNRHERRKKYKVGKNEMELEKT